MANTVSQSGVTRWDGGAASGNIYGPTVGDTSRRFQLGYNSGALNNSDVGTKTKTFQQQLEELVGNYQPNSGGSGSMTAAQLAQLNLDKDKFNYSKTQDAAAQDYQNQVFNYGKSQDAASQAAALEALQFGRNRDAGIASGYTNYYDGGKGQFNTGFDKLLGMITDQGKVSGDAVSGVYGRAMTGINEGYDAARGLGDSGYNALNTYLQANPNNPYAGMQAGVGSAPDALTQYLNAYGVSDQPVQGQIQADQLQAQQGAGNYQNLIDVLSGVAQSGASSRGAESAMGQNLFNTGLGQERAGYRGQAENAQAAALAQLQQQMFQSRFGVEGDRNNLSNQLAQAVIQAGGNVDGATTDKTDNQDDSEVSRTYEGIGPDRIRITKWTSGKETREPDPDKNYKKPGDTDNGNPTNQQIQLANLLRNVPGQDPNELFQALQARRGY